MVSAERRLAASSKLTTTCASSLEEDVDDRAAAQRRHLLHLAREHALEAARGVEDALDVLALQVVDVRSGARLAHGRRPAATRGRDRARPRRRSSVSSEAHRRPARARRRQVLAHVVGADRQLAVAAVDQHGQLHAGGPPVVEERVDRGADRAPGEEHVVDQHDRAARRSGSRARALTTGCAGERLGAARRHVVAVEGDVEGSRRGTSTPVVSRDARGAGVRRARRPACRCRRGTARSSVGAASRRSRARCGQGSGAARRRGARPAGGRRPAVLLSGLSGRGLKGTLVLRAA